MAAKVARVAVAVAVAENATSYLTMAGQNATSLFLVAVAKLPRHCSPNPGCHVIFYGGGGEKATS